MSTAFVRVVFAAVLALALTACQDPLAPNWDGLERAERLWAETAPAHYSFIYRTQCFCAAEALSIEVLNGEVVSVEPADPTQQPPLDAEVTGYTIEELLDRVRTELRRGPHDARTVFDQSHGIPVDVFFDYQENVIDEEWGFVVEDFTVLD